MVSEEGRGGRRDRWASSAGPLLVRTVWLGSHHHAVLTKDDPAARGGVPQPRQQTRRQRGDARKATKKRTTTNPSQSKDQSQTPIFDSFSELTDSASGTTTPSVADSGLTTAASSDKSRAMGPGPGPGTRPLMPGQKRPKTGAPTCGTDQARRHQTRTRSCLRHQMSCPGYTQMGIGGTNEATANGAPDDNQKDPLSNMLSDRVLQWLDLAGRVDGGSPGQQHQAGGGGAAPGRGCGRKRVASVQLYNIRIRNQTLLQADAMAAASAIVNGAGAAAAESKRVVPDSTRSRKGSAVIMAAESIEVPKIIGSIADIVSAIDPAGKSRAASAVSGVECKKQPPPAAPLMKTTGAGGNTKPKSKVPAVLSRSGAYEKAVERQHVERACNAQVARKQLHIFMPSLPGRRVMTSGDNESCLSTIPSELSQIQN